MTHKQKQIAVRQTLAAKRKAKTQASIAKHGVMTQAKLNAFKRAEIQRIESHRPTPERARQRRRLIAGLDD